MRLSGATAALVCIRLLAHPWYRDYRPRVASAPPASRYLLFVLADRRALWLLTAAYLAVNLVLLQRASVLNDEGLLVHYTATWVRFDLPAVFFLQKAKPVLSVFYALPAAAGVWWTMLAHLCVSALALPLIGEFARSYGYRLPNVPALVVAASPVFLLGGAAGIANNDAIVGTTLVLFLIGRNRSLAAGLVLGCLPWVRSEMLPLLVILWLHAVLIEPHRRFAIGAMLFPIAYEILGTVYHRDLLWMIHYPPSSPYNPNNPMWSTIPTGPQYFLGYVMTITPIAALVAAVPVRRLRPLERTLLVYLLLMAVLLDVLPIFKIGNFGGSPRYLSQLLPVAGLLVARALEIVWDGERLPLAAALAALALTAWSATRIAGQAHVAPLVIAFAAVVVLATLRLGRAAAAAAVAFILAGPLLVPGTQLLRSYMAPYLDPMAAWLRAHPDTARGPIYTNSQTLEAFTQLRRDLPPVDVRFLVGFDHLEGTLELSDTHNGQADAIRRLIERSFYGRGIIARALRPADVAPGTYFLLRLDRRLDITLPPEIWKDRLEILQESGGARIARLRPPT